MPPWFKRGATPFLMLRLIKVLLDSSSYSIKLRGSIVMLASRVIGPFDSLDRVAHLCNTLVRELFHGSRNTFDKGEYDIGNYKALGGYLERAACLDRNGLLKTFNFFNGKTAIPNRIIENHMKPSIWHKLPLDR